ncbi:MAG TPA: biotin--[acetyl-CoA-carboxylase] ligase [Chloroflexota bacterium]|jgi:BirA family biotin operon repressor/biotin-[acetyl-CoA-carboxylase] ligase
MADDRLAAAVQGLPAPWQGHFFDALDSTQDEAREAAQRGAPSHSLFVADFQRAGRGRASRRWLAPPGSALLMSILFREETQSPAIRPWRYTRLASLALIGSIDHHVPGAAAAIKWPNDVMLRDLKVAGILAETSWDGRKLRVIVGVGMNVSEAPTDVPGATCLQAARSAGSTPLDRGDLLLTFVSQLNLLLAEPNEVVSANWDARLWRRGQRLHLLDGDRDEEVVVLGAQPDGSLRVRSADGRERITTTGELLA